MRFLVDAQLPKSLARFFSERGSDAIHTLDYREKIELMIWKLTKFRSSSSES